MEPDSSEWLLPLEIVTLPESPLDKTFAELTDTEPDGPDTLAPESN